MPSSIRAVSRLLALGTDRISHRHASLFSHLVGTSRILEHAGYEPDTCAAALFHSIYGTSIFARAPLDLDDRPQIIDEIGPVAERLVWLFCAMNRAAFAEACVRGEPFELELERGQGRVALSRLEVEQLAALLWANHLEQATTAERVPAALEQVRAFVLRDVEAAARAVLGTERSTVTVEDLLAMPCSEFVARYWPSKLCVAHGDPRRFKAVFPSRIDEVTALPCSYITAYYANGSANQGSMKIPASQVPAMYAAGVTIYFHAVAARRFDGVIASVSSELGLLRRMTRVSCFASRRSAGIPMHYDMNDNIVIQVRGTKRWRIAENDSVRFPSEGFVLGKPRTNVHRAEAPRGFPDRFPDQHEVVEMRPGSVMFVPRGYWHDCETTDHESLHFNIQLGLPTWKDLVAFGAKRGLETAPAELREGIAHAFRDGVLDAEHRHQLLGMITRWFGELREADLAFKESEVDEFVARTRGN